LVGLFDQSSSEVQPILAPSAFPIRIEENREFLRTTESETRYEHLPPTVKHLLHVHEEITFTCTLRIPYSGGIRTLRYQEVRFKAVDVRSSQVAVRHRIEVACVDHGLASISYVEHTCT
jgi:hypothetical protein